MAAADYTTPNPYDHFHPPPLPPPPPPPPPLLPAASASPPALTAPLPTIADLEGAVHAIQNPQHDPFLRIAWCRDVLLLVDRAQQNPNPSTDPAVGPVVVRDSALQGLVEVAVRTILELASTGATPMPLYAAEAMYWRALFAATGGYPRYVGHNPRAAFRDFEAAARGQYHAAWFRLGRDYESFKDTQRARECFERGAKWGVESCTYRMGMAHLLGQLGLDVNIDAAMALLQRAAGLATVQVPQPAYAYALLLLNEFAQASIPAHHITAFTADPLHDARKYLERAAFLHFAPAQYKLGHAYEYAQPPFPFDPLLSVQYYSLASQQGEPEADMALSKWFLCGSSDTDAPGAGFDKDEALAFTFAQKAAKTGLPAAEFAMGYYAEVGVGQSKNIQNATMWYTRASQHGNTDAVERLAALSQPSPHILSRQEHVSITDDKLVRKRTMAKQRSDVVERQASLSSAQLRPQSTATGGTVYSLTDAPLAPPIPQPRRQSIATGGTVYSLTDAPLAPPIPQPRRQSTATGGTVYSLTDAPLAPPMPQPRHQSTATGRTVYSLTDAPLTPPTQQPQPQQQQSQSPPLPPPSSSSPPRPSKTGPATFAEMGIQGRHAEDDSCIIV